MYQLSNFHCYLQRWSFELRENVPSAYPCDNAWFYSQAYQPLAWYFNSPKHFFFFSLDGVCVYKRPFFPVAHLNIPVLSIFLHWTGGFPPKNMASFLDTPRTNYPWYISFSSDLFKSTHLFISFYLLFLFSVLFLWTQGTYDSLRR